MTAAPKLEPCPFCGSAEISQSLGKHGDGKDWPYIECEGCGAITEPDVWNRRAAPSAGLREALIELVETLEYEGHGDFAGDRSTCSICQEVKKARAALTLSKEGGNALTPRDEAQVSHLLWRLRNNDTAKHLCGLAATEIEALQKEVADLKHDLARHIEIASDIATDADIRGVSESQSPPQGPVDD